MILEGEAIEQTLLCRRAARWLPIQALAKKV